MQENAWMTEELILRGLQMLWGGVAASRERRLLVWDDFRVHKTSRVKVCADEVCNRPRARATRLDISTPVP